MLIADLISQKHIAKRMAISFVLFTVAALIVIGAQLSLGFRDGFNAKALMVLSVSGAIACMFLFLARRAMHVFAECSVICAQVQRVYEDQVGALVDSILRD